MKLVFATVAGILLGILGMIGYLQVVAITPVTLFISILFGVGIMVFGIAGILRFDRKLQTDQARTEILALEHQEFTGLEGLSGINADDFKQTIRNARSKIKSINEASMLLLDTNLRFKVLSLASVGNAIIEEVKSDPKDYRLARSWFNTFLDQTLSVVQRYIELESKSRVYKSNDKLTKDFEDTLDQLTENFNKLLNDLQSNDVSALQIDMEVLNDQLKQIR